MSEYYIRLQKLQKDFKEIKIKKANKWEFKPHQQAMYDFVMQSKRSTTFTINEYTITINVGNENFGFMHIILRHFCDGCDGEITAKDILNIGYVIKNNITVPSKKKGRVNFIQTKENGEKYTVVLTKQNPNDLIFTFFSSK